MNEQKKKWSARTFLVEPAGEPAFEITVAGRERWALECLIVAGKKGCTPIDTPGPRWSAYVFDLRHEFNVGITTHTEAHEGQFPGSHARYTLDVAVRPIDGLTGEAA